MQPYHLPLAIFADCPQSSASSCTVRSHRFLYFLHYFGSMKFYTTRSTYNVICSPSPRQVHMTSLGAIPIHHSMACPSENLNNITVTISCHFKCCLKVPSDLHQIVFIFVKIELIQAESLGILPTKQVRFLGSILQPEFASFSAIFPCPDIPGALLSVPLEYKFIRPNFGQDKNCPQGCPTYNGSFMAPRD